MANESIAREILETIACQHPRCGQPLTECDGSSHMAQSARHLTTCPLCGGAAHNNDSKSVMAFRCAMRQALAETGERFDDKSDVLNADQVRKLADWLETPGRVYGKEAAAKALVASGTTGIAAAKVGKRAGVVAPAPPVPSPTVAAAPPPTPHTPKTYGPCEVCGEPKTKLKGLITCARCMAAIDAGEPPPPPSVRVDDPLESLEFVEDFEVDEAEMARMTARLEKISS